MPRIKLSPLQDGQQKPWEDGVYLRSYRGDKDSKWFFAKYQEGEWYIGFYDRTAAQAATVEITSIHQALPWRGLAQKAKA